MLFSGTVTKFGRALSEDDVSLYHVEFDDGDEQVRPWDVYFMTMLFSYVVL